jgi:predicted nuclease of predicted toxin-antitoxin system
MRFLVDESVGARLATWLTEHGHDATAVGRDYPRSLPDDEILAIARREGRIIITNDTDFGELVFRERRPHAGVILLRLRTDTFAARCARLAGVLAGYAGETHGFLVVTDSDVRVRHE